MLVQSRFSGRYSICATEFEGVKAAMGVSSVRYDVVRPLASVTSPWSSDSAKVRIGSVVRIRDSLPQCLEWQKPDIALASIMSQQRVGSTSSTNEKATAHRYVGANGSLLPDCWPITSDLAMAAGAEELEFLP